MASSELEQLLQLQEHDTVIDQLRHRRASLPEREQLHQLEARQAEVATTLTGARQQRDQILRRQTELEAELQALESRLTELNGKLYGGVITASRELQAMAAEVESLKKRRSSLEDHTLEAMDEREPLDKEVERLEGLLADGEAENEKLQYAILEAEEGLEADEVRETGVRAGLAATLPAVLVEQYERIRSHSGGVGAARLVGSSCSGCHLSLPAVEVARLKKAAADAVVLCDQCGRILVRS
jgi:predicted  nucleic acid-binding Zn-ribbon protein